MKKVILSLLIISSISIFIGCNNSNNNEKSSVSKDNSTTISNDNKKSITKLNNEDKNTESKSISINSNDKKNSNSSTSTNINIENMLKDIKNKALRGEIINSNFKLKESNLVSHLAKIIFLPLKVHTSLLILITYLLVAIKEMKYLKLDL